MFNFSVQVTKAPPSAERIMKYMNNGIAIGLTKTAKEGQAAVVEAIQSKFINRKTWFAQQSPIGIKIQAASGDFEMPMAFIKTKAYFGKLQEYGGIKLPFSSTHLAIPAKGGPLANMRSIPDDLKPKALVRSGKAWIETTEKGTQLLVVRGLRDKGKYKGTQLMYILVAKAKIKPTHFFEEPIRKVVNEKLGKNIKDGMETTLARLSERG